MVRFLIVPGWFYKKVCLAGRSLEENVLDRIFSAFTLFLNTFLGDAVPVAECGKAGRNT